MNKMISIIIPTYNAAKYIEETMRSVFSQTYTPFEIVIVDDCSLDSTFNILVNFKQLGFDFRLLKNDTNRGLGYTFNRAVKESTGEWIIALGHDDLIPKDYLYKISRFFSPEISLVHTNHILIDEFNNYIPSIYSKKNIKSRFPFFFLSHENFISIIGVAINKRKFLNVNGLIEDQDNKITSEHLLWVKLATEGDIVFCSETKPFYRWHNGNLSHTITSIPNWNSLSIISKSTSLNNLYTSKNILTRALLTIMLKTYILIKEMKDRIRPSIRTKKNDNQKN